MTVGLLGGAFDPPHVGHVELACDALSCFRLERLVVVVTGRPPHKLVETGAETRLRLAEAAFGGLDRVEVSRWATDHDEPS
jgi:nicotinate-nucleotide adenylyltransferase